MATNRESLAYRKPVRSGVPTGVDAIISAYVENIGRPYRIHGHEKQPAFVSWKAIDSTARSSSESSSHIGSMRSRNSSPTASPVSSRSTMARSRARQALRRGPGAKAASLPWSAQRRLRLCVLGALGPRLFQKISRWMLLAAVPSIGSSQALLMRCSASITFARIALIRLR